jgi:hypothetical protein
VCTGTSTGNPIIYAGCIPENQCAYQKHVKRKTVIGSQKNSNLRIKLNIITPTSHKYENKARFNNSLECKTNKQKLKPFK